MLIESDILYENDKYWVCRADNGKGYEVYEVGTTHSRRCAIIGIEGEEGLLNAIKECDKRAMAQKLCKGG